MNCVNDYDLCLRCFGKFLQVMYDKQLGVEFKSEIGTLSQIEHINLVRCLGFLEHGDERVIVIEYVPRGTLREHLDGTFLILCICIRYSLKLQIS